MLGKLDYEMNKRGEVVIRIMNVLVAVDFVVESKIRASSGHSRVHGRGCIVMA